MFYIYRITNLINGKTYIGKHEYKKLNEYYMGSGVHLARAQKKYGIKNFKKDILVFNIPKLEQANLLEETFIAAEREKVGRKNCYNITDGGDGGPSFKGKHHSDKTRKRLAEAHKGKKLSEEHKKKIAEALKGKKREPFSDEWRKHLSEACRKRPAWNKGKSSGTKGKHWKLVDGKHIYY